MRCAISCTGCATFLAHSAFAAILDGGTVVTWGDARCGGDSSGVQDQLYGVRLVQASLGAFAALLEDGSVVTWGDAEHGADSSQVQHQLKLDGVFFTFFPATCDEPQMA